MRKVKILGAFVAVLAFGAFAVAGASASLWLVASKTPTSSTSAPMHEKIILVHTGGSLGSAKIECSVLLIGTVKEKEGSTTLVESLSGEKDLISGCTNLGGFCGGAAAHPTGLPWLRALIEILSGTFLEYMTSGYNILCSFGIQVECKGKVMAEFEGNGTNGAKFGFKGAASGEQECSDGGKGTLESSGGEVLGATIS